MYPGAIQNISGTGASDHDRPKGVLRVNHVRYTSVKEYKHKRCVRGRANLKKLRCDSEEKLGTMDDVEKGKFPEHLVHRPGNVHDDGAWRRLVERVPRYGAYDKEGWEDYF
mmetsp:Transcript_40925/g.123432  ORF Transcript_40925/g.123432 Transcript_40925/m.123432 type:complete len:111 (+) Transcript_40925:623-955(+)